MGTHQVLQIIDENKVFNQHLGEYLVSRQVDRAGLGYHLVSVFGSQSTGKSTLLNALFGTTFGVMADQARGQTTHGIWLGLADLENSAHTAGQAHNGPASKDTPLFVLDVEGTDGRERGEDQDFERKAALFALASSEVLIVNMWEHQVGLYQGANMGLLKTVFEVNLSLFQTSGKAPRSQILFVIRDHIGTTPLANLAETLLTDLERHWQTIAKPTPELEKSKISDFFDITFTALPHKVLLPDQFVSDVNALRGRFIDPKNPDFVFRKEYHRQVPLDGWPIYANQIWEQIELNKDLDLPTQQILVARFRCQEIADAAWKNFTESVSSLTLPLGTSHVVHGFGAALRPLRTRALDEYDSQAAKYDPKVYATQRLELLGKIDALLSAHYRALLAALQENAILAFKKSISSSTSSGASFAVAATSARQSVIDTYSAAATEGILDPSCYSFHTELDGLHGALDAETKSLRATEMTRLANTLSKSIGKDLDDNLPTAFNSEHPWQNVQEVLERAIKAALKPYADGQDFGLGSDETDNADGRKKVVSAAWRSLDKRLVELVRREVVLQRLRDRFEEKFMYDAAGVPVLWKQGDDIETAFVSARDSSLKILPLYSSATLPNGTYLERPKDVESELASSEESPLDYQRLIAPAAQEEIRTRFKRDANNSFLSAKRSVSQTAVHIPYYIWAALVLLGWNEFMAILRNPLLVALTLVLAAGGYVLYSLNLIGPALAVADTTFAKIQDVGKQKLREYLEMDKPQRPEEYELQDLSARSAQNTSSLTDAKARSDTVLSTSKPDSAAAADLGKKSASTASLRRPSDDVTTTPKLAAPQRRGSIIEATPMIKEDIVSVPVLEQKLPAPQRSNTLDENVIL